MSEQFFNFQIEQSGENKEAKEKKRVKPKISEHIAAFVGYACIRS
jgi:hypothetical protein